MLFIAVWNDSSVNPLSHDLVTLIVTLWPLYCWSSSSDGVDWMCISIRGNLVVCDGCISILIVLIRHCFLRGLLWYQSAVVLFDRGHPWFGISIPFSLFMLLGWSLMWVWVAVNKLNLVPKRLVSGLIGMFWDSWGLSLCFSNIYRLIYTVIYTVSPIYTLPHS